MVNISFYFTKKEVLLLHLKSILKSHLIWGVILFIFVTSFIPVLDSYQKLSPKGFDLTLFLIIAFVANALQALFFGIAMLLGSFLLGLYRLWKSQELITKAVHYSFSSERIVLQDELSKIEYDWKSLKKITQDKNYFYLQIITGLQLVVIPKRGYKSASDLEKFVQLIKQKKL